MMEYRDKLERAEEHKEEIARVFKRLKKKSPKKLDQVFHDAHDKAFQEIDCLACANCCKTTSPIFRDVDIKRIAKKLKMSEGQFESDYLQQDEDKDWILKSSPCAFLADDNSCDIYDFRPLACREFPHTDRKRMNQILDLTVANTQVCPAVADIALDVIEELT